MGIAGDIALILVVAFAGGVIAQRLGLPIILGYIVAGIVVGPNTPGPTVGNLHDVELLAEIGVALLLFAIGLHFSVEELTPVRRIALIGTPIQILLVMGFGYGLGVMLLGLGWEESVWLGALLSLSSTAVVLKTLTEQGVINTLSGRVMIGMLIAQDLAVVPMVILLPELSNLGSGLPEVGRSVLEMSAFIGGMAIFGTRIFPWVMGRIVRLGSRELFLVAVVAAGLGVGYATYLFGLSFAFGAFIAGMVLSRSDYSHQALAEVEPLRDVFAMIFFVSIGMLIEPSFLLENAGLVAGIVALVFVGKALIFGGISRIFGYGNIVPFATALGMFQVGEFSFVIAQRGVSEEVVSQQLYSIALTTAVITMAITPFATRLSPLLYGRWRQRFPRETLDTFNIPQTGLRNHVVVVGYGRVGMFVSSLLKRLGQPFVVVEYNPDRVDLAREEGMPAVFGDGSTRPVLEAAGLSKARLVVVTVPDALGVELVVERIRGINPDVHLVVRSASADQLHTLRELGVYEAVQPEFEAGIELGRQALVHLGFGAVELQRISDEIRHELYAPISGDSTESEMLSRLDNLSRIIEAEWVQLPEDSPLHGKAIGEIGVRTRFGVSVVAIARKGENIPTPGPELEFQSGDAVAVLGTMEQREGFKEFALPHR